ncbi:MAG TPA: hypothetical protein VFN10_06455, partial [Thermoanaerobaculia bacterium]|nr:hypothetical protein [Thermoanaerobaculia bacterium]
MSEASFGFGQRVTKATGGEVVNIADIEALKVFFRAPGALERFGESPKTLVVLAAGTYDFTNEPFPAIEIRRKNLTITANDADVVVFKNFQLAIDLALSDNILIENLNFRSDGLPSHPRDGIKTLDNSEIKRVRGTSVSQTPVTPASLSLRITHCSFDGYFDIAIDSSVKSKPRPRLLATIDHCLFFDSRPGQPTTRVEQG